MYPDAAFKCPKGLSLGNHLTSRFTSAGIYAGMK
jgi:hypothetical protein